MTNNDQAGNILAENVIAFKRDVLLYEISSFKIGGKADMIVFPKSEEELALALRTAKGLEARFLAVGNMSNLLFDDAGFSGILISTKNIRFCEYDGCDLRAGAGGLLTQLALEAAEKGLSGLEFGYGIPGTVGGAVFMNAGAYGGEIKDIVLDSTAYNPESDEFVTLTADEHAFGYRYSAYMDLGLVITSAKLRLEKGDPKSIKDRMNELMNRRREKQPLEYPSAGSIFKRCEGHYTGQMIEESGLKGLSVGGAQISEKHAGFIINRGGATSADVLKLINIIKETVKRNYGVELQCEVRYIAN